jgi:hypothetical protein
MLRERATLASASREASTSTRWRRCSLMGLL